MSLRRSPCKNIAFISICSSSRSIVQGPSHLLQISCFGKLFWPIHSCVVVVLISFIHRLNGWLWSLSFWLSQVEKGFRRARVFSCKKCICGLLLRYVQVHILNQVHMMVDRASSSFDSHLSSSFVDMVGFVACRMASSFWCCTSKSYNISFHSVKFLSSKSVVYI